MSDSRLTAARRAAQLTQAQLAKAAGCGLDQATISKLERAQRAPSVHKAVAIARALGTSVEALWPPAGVGRNRSVVGAQHIGHTRPRRGALTRTLTHSAEIPDAKD